MEMFKKDPFVLQLGARYASDPEFRRSMNHQLSTKSAGYPLLRAYNSLKNPPKPEIQRNVNAQNEAPPNEEGGRIRNQRQQQIHDQLNNLQMPFA